MKVTDYEKITAILPDGDRFETGDSDHLYGVHLDIVNAHPSIPLGGFRLDFVGEDEEKNGVFQVVMDDDYHTSVSVLFEDTDDDGDLIFEICWTWCDLDISDDPYESWSITIGVNSQDQYCMIDYECDEKVWHNSLDDLFEVLEEGDRSYASKTMIETIRAMIIEMR